MKTIFTLLLSVFAIFMVNNSTSEDVDAKVFQQYLDSFEKKELPYSIDESDFFFPRKRKIAKKKPTRKQLGKFRNENVIQGVNLDFIPFKQAMYSRMGPDEYTYEAELALSKDYKAVVVGGMRPFGGNQPFYYTLITYDLKGEVISHREIAQSYGKLNIQRCNISKQGEIVIEHVENEILDDKIVSTEIIKTEKFLVLPSGEIKASESLIRRVMPEIQQITPVVKTAKAANF